MSPAPAPSAPPTAPEPPSAPWWGWPAHGLRAGLGAVFLYAGWQKLGHSGRFFEEVQTFQLLPYPLAYATAAALPWLEVLAGAAALAGPLRRGAVVVLLALTLAFMGGVASAWARGLDIVCGCFGGAALETSSHAGILLRNTALAAGFALVLAAEAALARRRRVRETPPP